MLLLHQTEGQDVTLDSLDNGPGLLPFKLGATRIVSHYHSFLHYINFTSIDTQVDSVKSQMLELRPLLNNKTLSLFEPHLEYLDAKIEKISNQLHIFETGRNRRGLIDGLGSVIKSISGNLDYTDAIKYENAIKTLQDNEQKLESELNSHVSLNQNWVSHSSKVIENIIINQDKLSKVLNIIMESDSSRDTDLIKYAHMAQHLLILGDNIAELSDELVSLEYTLSFIRASSTPYSILSLVQIKDMLSKIRILYSNDEILDVDARNFYEIVKLGYFYLDKQVVIVIKVPIADPASYDLYRLSIVPNANRNVLIPSSPFIAISGKDSRYMEAECPKIETWFLCQPRTNYEPRDKPDCVQQLIAQQVLNQSCALTPVILTHEALEQLDDKHYTLSFPTETKVKITCGQEQYRTLRGSYLAVIPLNCHLKAPEFTISNMHDRVKGHVIRIMEMPQYDESRPSEHPPLILNTINLQNLHSISTKISSEAPVHIETSTNRVIYHTTIPIYMILLSMGTFIMAVRYCRRKRNEFKIKSSESSADVPRITTITATPAARIIDPTLIRVDHSNISATLSCTSAGE